MLWQQLHCEYIYTSAELPACWKIRHSAFNTRTFQLSPYSPLNGVYKVSKTVIKTIEIKYSIQISLISTSRTRKKCNCNYISSSRPLLEKKTFLPPPFFAKFPCFIYLNEERRMCNIFSDQSQYSSLRNVSSYKVTRVAVQYPSIFYPFLTHREWIREQRWRTAVLSPKHHKNKRLSNIPCKSILNTSRFLTLLLFLDYTSLLYKWDFK